MNPAIRLLAVFVLVLAAATPAHALRCGSRIVGTDDYDFQARDRCGDPFWVEDHYRIIVDNRDAPVQTVQQITYTAWFYNFGKNRLLVRLLFRDGRLVRENTLGRGVDDIGDSCGPAKLVSGMSSGELVAYCGEPLSRHAQPGATQRRLAPGIYSQSDSYREDWIYDLGGDFLYIAHLLNGHIDSVEHVRR
ncbi:MAG TPA: DUF2845 domain-containing protein [Rudaea sp.]|jgi:hypothetical protein